MDNVVLTPHVGSATHETRAAMGRLTLDNLVAHFAGKPVLTPVPLRAVGAGGDAPARRRGQPNSNAIPCHDR